jgi:D-alanyl-D-alanine carboxypeptidase
MLSSGQFISAQNPLQQVDELLQQHYRSSEPGVAVAISQNGKIMFNKCYGLSNLADHTPIKESTNFNIASNTKQFTAAAILQLASQKKLSLTDPISKYFPSFNSKIGHKLTIHHLLTHSSGIVDHYGNIDTKIVKHANDHDVLKAVENIDSLYFEPGTHYRYSNTAYCLLACIIEKVSGLSYSDYIKKNIFSPLGMTHSTVLSLPVKIYQQAIGYEWDSATNQFNKSDADESAFFSTEGDGGIYTSIDDYLKWFQGLQQSRILPAPLLEQARSTQFEIDASKQLGYGSGWFVGAMDQTPVVYHTGSNGGFRSIVFTIPSKNYLMVIFSNRTGVDLEQLAIEINKILRVDNKSFARVESLVSFQQCWPIFAPCKKIISFLTSLTVSWNANVMVLN